MNGACISDALNTPGYEERLGCHTGAAEPGGVPVALRFYTDDDDDLEPALRRERGVSATFTLVDGIEVRLPVSLLGFTAALRARRDLLNVEGR